MNEIRYQRLVHARQNNEKKRMSKRHRSLFDVIRFVECVFMCTLFLNVKRKDGKCGHTTSLSLGARDSSVRRFELGFQGFEISIIFRCASTDKV